MGSMTIIKWRQIAASALLLGMASFAHAMEVEGATVTFAFDENKLVLFSGATYPYAVGDTLIFKPDQFATGVTPVAMSTIHIDVTPKTGWLFSSASLQESGKYTRQALDVMSVVGQLRIKDPNEPLGELTASIISPTFQTGKDQDWDISVNQGISVFSDKARLTFTIQNILTAMGAPVDSINKTQVELSIVTSPVPEVETWAMMLAGVGLIGLQLRRRNGGARVIR